MRVDRGCALCRYMSIDHVRWETSPRTLLAIMSLAHESLALHVCIVLACTPPPAPLHL